MYSNEQLPPGQVVTTKFPIMVSGLVPKINLSDWKLRIFGLEKEITLGWTDILALPKVCHTSDIHCVTTWSRLNNQWEGVTFADLLKSVDLLPTVNYVVIHAEQGYSVSLRLDDLFRDGVLLAYSHDGTNLTPEHGFPLRLVVPHLYFWKSVKWVCGIEFSQEYKPSFWETHGYHERGDVWKEQRYKT